MLSWYKTELKLESSLWVSKAVFITTGLSHDIQKSPPLPHVTESCHPSLTAACHVLNLVCHRGVKKKDNIGLSHGRQAAAGGASPRLWAKQGWARVPHLLAGQPSSFLRDPFCSLHSQGAFFQGVKHRTDCPGVTRSLGGNIPRMGLPDSALSYSVFGRKEGTYLMLGPQQTDKSCLGSQSPGWALLSSKPKIIIYE